MNLNMVLRLDRTQPGANQYRVFVWFPPYLRHVFSQLGGNNETKVAECSLGLYPGHGYGRGDGLGAVGRMQCAKDEVTGLGRGHRQRDRL